MSRLLRDLLFLLGMARRNNWRAWAAIWRTSRPAASRRRRQTVELIVAMRRVSVDTAAVRRVDGNVIELRRRDD